MKITLNFETKTITINEDIKISDLLEVLKKHNIDEDFKIEKINIIESVINTCTCNCNKNYPYKPIDFWYTNNSPNPYCTSNLNNTK